ncbi:MAG: patatin-like phospholipase family protein [Oscillochloris sp.]|nr:patatin-like phospholipase family protein [Oscillochloris sp.]
MTTIRLAARQPQVILALQGGGALGAYHIGAYQALSEAGYTPDWVTGISIGAINAALIAGNPPERRMDQLAGFWEAISRPGAAGAMLDTNARRFYNRSEVSRAILFGQPGFFTPRLIGPYTALPGTPSATSFYDTTPLYASLRRFLDFDLLNENAPRISLGATRVTSGELVFFDNTRQRIGPEHVIASGSLPPGFPATLIDGEAYWDGGCVVNTPLQAVLDDPPADPSIVFMIDLWNVRGAEPRTLDDVLWRQKQIQYASRSAHEVQTAVQMLNMRWMIREMRDLMSPAERAQLPAPTRQTAGAGHVDLVHIVYQPRRDEIAQSDAEFSRDSLAARREQGYADMGRVLAQSPWQTKTLAQAARVGATVHFIEGDTVNSYTPEV